MHVQDNNGLYCIALRRRLITYTPSLGTVAVDVIYHVENFLRHEIVSSANSWGLTLWIECLRSGLRIHEPRLNRKVGLVHLSLLSLHD